MYPTMPGQGENEEVRSETSTTGVDSAGDMPNGTDSTPMAATSVRENAASTLPASTQNKAVSPASAAVESALPLVKTERAENAADIPPVSADTERSSEPTWAESLANANTDVDTSETADPINPVVAEANAVNDVAQESNVIPGDADVVVSDSASTDANASQPAPETSGAPRKFRRGDLIEGTIKSTSPTAVIIDLDGEHEGFIPTSELERMGRRAIEELTVGARMNVYIVNPRDHNGQIVLSVNRAMEEMDWQQAETFRQSQQVYDSRVAGYNKGGLIVRFGRLRGFVPQSQMSADRRRILESDSTEERWKTMVNEPITVKVVEVDRVKNRLILSERSASRENREKRKENLIQQLNVGEVRMGRVVSLEDFGAFIDIGGAEGLVHLTEMSWQHITHPKEMLEVGQEVKVEVISVDPNAKRIGLSMKRQAADPWDTIALGFQVGQLVQGTVTKLTKFGAFAQIIDVPEIEGLIHISELSEQRVTHPREVVEEGDRLTLRVVKIDVKDRRLGLSLKKVTSPEYLDTDWASMYAAPDTSDTAQTPDESFEPTYTPEPSDTFEPTNSFEPDNAFEPMAEAEPDTAFEPTAAAEPDNSFAPTVEEQAAESFEPTDNSDISLPSELSDMMDASEPSNTSESSDESER